MISDFFKPATNTKPFVKAAFQGFPGSGKTVTMSKLAAGLHKRISSTKPVVMLDTERASQWIVPIFKNMGIEILVRETRSFTDLEQAMKLCADGASDILLIDSITHFWEALQKAHLEAKSKKAGRSITHMSLPDYGQVSPVFKTKFNTTMVDAPFHILFAGRAGDDWRSEENEDGKMEMFKTDRMKMKVQNETGYEPDLLVAMDRLEKGVVGGELDVWREAKVLKCRCPEVDGKTFEYRASDKIDKVYKDFEPFIEMVLGSPNFQTPATGNDSLIFPTEEARINYHRERTIMCEEIKELLVAAYPGTAEDKKKAKLDLVEEMLGTRSWTKVEDMSLDTLKDGYDKIRGRLLNLELIKAKPMPEPATTEMELTV